VLYILSYSVLNKSIKEFTDISTNTLSKNVNLICYLRLTNSCYTSKTTQDTQTPVHYGTDTHTDIGQATGTTRTLWQRHQKTWIWLGYV